MQQIMNQLIEKRGNKKQQMQNAEVQNTHRIECMCASIKKGCQHIVKDDLSHYCGGRRQRERTCERTRTK